MSISIGPVCAFDLIVPYIFSLEGYPIFHLQMIKRATILMINTVTMRTNAALKALEVDCIVGI